MSMQVPVSVSRSLGSRSTRTSPASSAASQNAASAFRRAGSITAGARPSPPCSPRRLFTSVIRLSDRRGSSGRRSSPPYS